MEHYNIRHDNDNYSYILASDNACWNAKDWGIGIEYSFKAPVDGTIAGAKLQWKSGGTIVDIYDESRYRTYFGSSSGFMHVQMVRITNELTLYGQTYYPRINGTDWNTVHVDNGVLCPQNNRNGHGCKYEYYDMRPYVFPIEPVFNGFIQNIM